MFRDIWESTIGGTALLERALLGVGFGRAANHCNYNCVHMSDSVKPSQRAPTSGVQMILRHRILITRISWTIR
jgi:hypothetical protein